MNLWLAFLGAGVSVTRVSDDYREVDVKLKPGPLNRNYFGTQFGGALFAVADPFFALMMLKSLGAGCVVRDKAGAIRYRKPGRGDVLAHFRLGADAIARARRATARGGRHEPMFTVAIVDRGGETVAEVDKTLCVRGTPAREAAPAPPTRRRRGKA